MATIRYRARIVPGDADEIRSVALRPTRAAALKDGVDLALSNGLIVVDEVPVEQKVKREWVEIEK